MQDDRPRSNLGDEGAALGTGKIGVEQAARAFTLQRGLKSRGIFDEARGGGFGRRAAQHVEQRFVGERAVARSPFEKCRKIARAETERGQPIGRGPLQGA